MQNAQYLANVFAHMLLNVDIEEFSKSPEAVYNTYFGVTELTDECCDFMGRSSYKVDTDPVTKMGLLEIIDLTGKEQFPVFKFNLDRKCMVVRLMQEPRPGQRLLDVITLMTMIHAFKELQKVRAEGLAKQRKEHSLAPESVAEDVATVGKLFHSSVLNQT